MTTAPDADELAVRARLKQLIDGAAPAVQPDAVDTAAAAAIAQPTRESAAEPVSDADVQPDAPRRIRNRIPDWRTGRHVDLTPEPDADAQPGEETQPDADAQPVQDVQPDADEETEDAEEGEPDADAQPRRRRPRLRIPTAPRTRTRSRGTSAGYEAVIAAPAPKLSLLEAAQNVAPRVRWLVLHASAAAAGYRVGLVQWSTRSSAWCDAHGWLNISAGFYVALAVGCELLRRKAHGNALVLRWLAAIPIASLVTGALLYGTGWQNLELPL